MSFGRAQGFGRRPDRNVPGVLADEPDALELPVREEKLRTVRDILTSLALLAFALANIALVYASGRYDPADGKLHIPDNLVDWLPTGNWLVTQVPDTGFSGASLLPISLVLLSVTIQCLQKRRSGLSLFLLLLCLFPWQWAGIRVYGQTVCALLILAYHIREAYRGGDRLRYGLIGLVIALLFVLPDRPQFLHQPDPPAQKALYPSDVEKTFGGTVGISRLSVPAELVPARTYVAVQDRLLSGDLEGAAALVETIAPDAFDECNFEADRVLRMRQILGYNGALKNLRNWSEAHALFIWRLVGLSFSGFALLAFLGNIFLNVIMGRMQARSQTIRDLSEDYREASRPATMETTEAQIAQLVRGVRSRAWTALTLSVALAVLSLFALGLYLHWSPLEQNNAFIDIHVPLNIINDLSDQGMELQPGLPDPITYTAGGVLKYLGYASMLASLFLWFRKEFRLMFHARFFVVLMWVSFFSTSLLAILLGANFWRSPEPVRKRTGQLLVLAGFLLMGMTTSDMMFAGKLELPIEQAKSIYSVQYRRMGAVTEKSDLKERQLAAGYRYGMAQIDYLEGNLAGLREHLHWIYQNGGLKSYNALHRLALMRAWSERQGADSAYPEQADVFVTLLDLEGRLSRWSRMIATLAAAGALLSGAFASLMFARINRMNGMADLYLRRARQPV